MVTKHFTAFQEKNLILLSKEDDIIQALGLFMSNI